MFFVLFSEGRTKKLGLKSLSSTFLGVELDKDWRVRCQSWEDETLSPAHIEYASNDALVSVYVAVAVAVEKFVQVTAWEEKSDEFEDLISFSRSLCLPYAGLKYSKFQAANSSQGESRTPFLT